MNNYEFCADFALTAARTRPGFKVLDFGCGAGEIVGLMTAAGLDAYGCDPYYEGGDLHACVPAQIRNRVCQMHGDTIPFPDQTFDLVVTNTVLEHVADLDASTAEIARVLKPGGACLAIFPHLEVWREGHCNIPFLHRLPRSGFRVYYAAALHAIGLGNYHDNRSAVAWARAECEWLDKWCHYRPLATIRATFEKHFARPQHIEAAWMAKRKAVSSRIPALLRVAIARKAAGVVFVAERR